MTPTSSPDVTTYVGSTNFYSCLALDLASQSGWAVANNFGKVVQSGTFVLEGDDCEKLAMLLDNLLHIGKVTTVAIERPWIRGPNTLFLMALRGVAMAAAGKWGAEFHEYSPATVKKAVTGDGHATKETVMRFVEKITGIAPGTDDEADAISVMLCWLNRAKKRAR